MNQAQPCPQQAAKAAIKRKQAVVRTIAKRFFQSSQKQRPDPTGPEHLAFEPEVTDFVVGIDDPHRAVEFETIDDLRRGDEADMLRPQVAVALDDLSTCDAGFDDTTHLAQTDTDTVEQGGHARCRELEFGAHQQLAVDFVFLKKVPDIC
ncbi:hypothetical protein ILFOPFJJ_05760 [Ensifer psoraleae]|uniref:hypothetical protein n=1 Tax=Sinorhizobium psoraleae TaxID=520838 RepID=UPI001FE88D94|nr:hypothetical protein [Sinorhizobium psoraleae]NRP74837.1 hypothetical protein [Sinorhizobium psoraleae]